MFKKWTAFSIALFSFFIVSCISMAHYEKIDEAVVEGNFETALNSLQEVKDTKYKDKDKILYYLDEGMLAHYAKNYDLSAESLGKAERGIEQAVTKSITLETSTYLVNDSVQEYSGDDYEDLYLNVFNALNYWKKGSLEGALVEVRRFDNKIKFLSTKYGQVITNSQKAVLEKDKSIPYDPKAATMNFSNSALGQYLGMLFYRSEGHQDDARINRNFIKLAFANHPHLYPFPLPESIEEELNIPKDMARVNFLTFVGPSPIKTEDTIRIQISNNNWIKIALPTIIKRPSKIEKIDVKIDNGPRVNIELIEDMAEVAIETFKQKAAFIYFKTVLRSIAKTSVSASLGNAMEESGNIAFGLLSMGTQIYAEASEQADLRMSRYFPAKAYVGGTSLTPGLYSFTIYYYDAGGNIVYNERFENIEVQAGKLNLLEAVCIK